ESCFRKMAGPRRQGWNPVFRPKTRPTKKARAVFVSSHLETALTRLLFNSIQSDPYFINRFEKARTWCPVLHRRSPSTRPSFPGQGAIQRRSRQRAGSEGEP